MTTIEEALMNNGKDSNKSIKMMFGSKTTTEQIQFEQNELLLFSNRKWEFVHGNRDHHRNIICGKCMVPSDVILKQPFE